MTVTNAKHMFVSIPLAANTSLFLTHTLLNCICFNKTKLGKGLLYIQSGKFNLFTSSNISFGLPKLLFCYSTLKVVF